MVIYDMRTQNLVNPIGLGTTHPTISWKLSADRPGERQTAYRITAAATEEELAAEQYFLWDTGKIESSDHTGIQYDGKTLQSRQQVYWRVKVWDRDGRESHWSEVCTWEMGLLEICDWKAKWITRGKEAVLCKWKGNLADYTACAPVFAKEFEIDCSRKIRYARMYISGLGIYEAYINGHLLGQDTYFNPGESDVRDTVYYVTYDIKQYLDRTHRGGQTAAFLLGNGQYANYRVHRQSGRYYKTDDARKASQVEGMFGGVKGIAQIVIHYEDGMEQVIGTDESWRFIESPITENSWYGGEDYNALLEIPRWNTVDPEIPRTDWGQAAEAKDIPEGTLRARECYPITLDKSELILPENISVKQLKIENGYRTYLVDMGRNAAGIPEITIDTKTAGLKIVLYPAEVCEMTGFQGHINQESCTQSESRQGNLIYDSYITNHDGIQTYRPRMCYHGYQYLEVVVPEEILLSSENFRGFILRTNNEKTGYFECSDQLLNRINTLTERSIESNMFSTFTDCPQIEKLGWLETPGLMFYSMSQTYNISTWIPKIIQDIKDAQYKNGRIAAIAPEYFKIGSLYEDVNWNGSLIFTAWQYYEVYKDASIFSDTTYRAMKHYMLYLERDVAEDNLICQGQMGEWGEMTSYGITPLVLVETTAYYRLAVCMSKIADVLGENLDRIYYENLSKKIKHSFHENKDCYNEKYLYGNGTQSGYGCVLFSGIYLEDHKSDAVERLEESIRRADYHLTSGEVGLKQVFSVLAEYGKNDIIYKMVTNDSMPSYKYFVDKGLTALPEYWNFEELWGTVARSRNHAMMGHVKEWFHRYLLGVNPISPGYDEISVKPAILKMSALSGHRSFLQGIYGTKDDTPTKMTYARGNVDTIHGIIHLEWEHHFLENRFLMKLSLPIGILATIYIPALYAQGSLFCNEKTVEYNKTDDGKYYVLTDKMGAGEYILVYIAREDSCVYQE